MKSPQILTRRSFLSHATALGLGTALASLTDVPLVVQRALAEGSIGLPGANGRVKKLLFIFLRGANDGLNAVIPHGDPGYSRAMRPTLHIPPDPEAPWQNTGPAAFPQSGPARGTFLRSDGTPLGGLGLGNGFASLHPSLKFLAPVYNAGHLALVHRVAYPDQSRSHFDSEVYWETGLPREDSVKEGMLHRAMVESGLASKNALTGVSFQSSLPMILRGSRAAMTNLNDPRRYGLLGVPNTPAGNLKADHFLTRANAAQFTDKRSRDLLQLQYDNLNQTIDIFASLNFDENFVDANPTDGDAPYSLFPTSNAANGGWAAHDNDPAKYVVPTGSYEFFQRLKSAALVLNKTDAIVAGTQIDGWDTHSEQGTLTGSHPNLLRRVGWALYGLQRYFLQHGDKCRWDDLVVVTLSEFGRTTIENDDQGTDHAEASVMFLAGGSVKGYRPAGGGNPARSGVHGIGPADPIPWQTGPNGSMFQADDRYLKRCYDYRSVLGKVIRDHLGATQAQLDRIIPGYARPGEALKGGVQTEDNTRVAGEPDIV
jgi:uncharacterized protein (DUF1501 family)